MKWNCLFVCDNIFLPIRDNLKFLNNDSNNDMIIREKLHELNDKTLLKQYLLDQSSFEEILQLCTYGISMNGRDTNLVIKCANILLYILKNLWGFNDDENNEPIHDDQHQIQPNKLTLGENLLKIFHNNDDNPYRLPIFVHYEYNYYTKIILKYLVYAFVPTSTDFDSFFAQSQICLKILMFLNKLVSASETIVHLWSKNNCQIEDRSIGYDLLSLDRENIVVNDDLIHFITDFYVVSIGNWSCQRLQYYSHNTFSNQLNHITIAIFGSLFHLWLTLSIRVFPVSIQWNNLRNLISMNLYKPVMISEWSKILIFITRLFVMKLTIDSNDNLSTTLHHNECENNCLEDKKFDFQNNHSLKMVNLSLLYKEILMLSPAYYTLCNSSVVLQLWFRFLFLFNDPMFFMNCSYYMQEAFVISDREGVLDLNNTMMESCAHINKNTMNDYFPILEKYLPISFNHYISTVEVVLDALFYDHTVSNYVTDANLECVISPSNNNFNSRLSCINNYDQTNSVSSNLTSNPTTYNVAGFRSSFNYNYLSDNKNLNYLHENLSPNSQHHITSPDMLTGVERDTPSPSLSPPNISGDRKRWSDVAHSNYETTHHNDTVVASLANNYKNLYSLSQLKKNNSNANFEYKSLTSSQYDSNHINDIHATHSFQDRSVRKNTLLATVAALNRFNEKEIAQTNSDHIEYQKKDINITLNKNLTPHNTELSTVDCIKNFTTRNRSTTTVESDKHVDKLIQKIYPQQHQKKLHTTQPPSTDNSNSTCNNNNQYSYKSSFGTDETEILGFNIRHYVCDCNIKISSEAGRVKAKSVLKIINPWLTDFLIPNFKSPDDLDSYHNFLMEKVCILMNDYNINCRAAGVIPDDFVSCSSETLYLSDENYENIAQNIFKLLHTKSSIVLDEWLIFSRQFSMKNGYELGRSIIIKLVCHLISDFSTSHKMPLSYHVNMYTLINYALCYQMTDANIILTKIIKHSTCLFQSDLMALYTLMPIFYNAVNIILTCKKFNQLNVPIIVSDSSATSNNKNNEANVRDISMEKSPTINLKRCALTVLLSLLNLPFHEYSLMFSLDRLKDSNRLNQLPTLHSSVNQPNHDGKKYVYMNSALIEFILHTLKYFVHNNQLDYDYIIIFSCISTLFWNCKTIEAYIISCPDTKLITNKFCHINGNEIGELSNENKLNTCVKSKEIFMMSVEIATNVLIKISSYKHFNLSVVISVINFLSNFSTVHINYMDRSSCMTLIGKICNFIYNQASKAPIYHNKQLHSTILAAYLCINQWLLLQPWIIDDFTVRNNVISMIEFGIFGKNAGSSSKDSKSASEIDHKVATIQVYNSISLRVAEISETVIHLLSCSRNYNAKLKSISQYNNINENMVLKKMNDEYPDVANSAKFFYFIYQRIHFISFIEYPSTIVTCNCNVDKFQKTEQEAVFLFKPKGLIIFRSSFGKKIFEVEFDPVHKSKLSSYASSLNSYEATTSYSLQSDNKNNNPLASNIAIKSIKSNISNSAPSTSSNIAVRRYHFPEYCKPYEKLIPFNAPSYCELQCDSISKKLFLSFKQTERRSFNNQKKIFSQLTTTRFLRPPPIKSKYNTIQLFLSQFDLINMNDCKARFSTDTFKHGSLPERSSISDNQYTQSQNPKPSMIVSGLPSFDWRQLEIIDPDDLKLHRQVTHCLTELDHISTRRTETVLIFYIDKLNENKIYEKNLANLETEVRQLYSKNSSLFPSNTKFSPSTCSYEGSPIVEKLFNEFLNSIGICVNSLSHQKWCGIKCNNEQVSKQSYDFLYREDWTSETAVIIDSWIPTIIRQNSLTSSDDMERNWKKVFKSMYQSKMSGNESVSKSVDSGTISNITHRKLIHDVFAVVWMDNFNYFELIKIDQMVSSLFIRSGLDPEQNFVRFIIFLRHMKNDLICIHTFKKKEGLWEPFYNSALPSGLVVHPDNLTPILFNGISSISVLHKLTTDNNIDPLAKRKHYIQQTISKYSNNPLKEQLHLLNPFTFF